MEAQCSHSPILHRPTIRGARSGAPLFFMIADDMKTLIWFRDDLRTEDHSALLEAVKRGRSGVAGLFIATPLTWKKHRVGSPRVTFTLSCLASLKSDLEAIGIPLIFREVPTYADIPQTVADIVRSHDIDEIHAGLEYGVDEIARDRAVSLSLKGLDASLNLCDTQTILPVYRIRNKAGLPYKVFTPFRKAWEEMYLTANIEAPNPPSETVSSGIASTPLPDAISGFAPWTPKSTWTGGSETAIARLKRFIEEEKCFEYKNTRDRPDLDGTSTLSPWLATGSLSASRCLTELSKTYGPDITSWPEGPRCWQGELVWREFYRYVMASFPEVSQRQPMQQWTTDIDWRDSPKDLQAWKDGRTGIDIVDAGMIQLKETGWMHNRVRMVVAMFLSKNLLIDWRHGEDHFSSSLVDYDFASNNGGWQWAASTGTDAAPYFRIFNAETQGERFDHDGNYRRQWLRGRPKGTVPPIVDLKTSRVRAIETFKAAQADWQMKSH